MITAHARIKCLSVGNAWRLLIGLAGILPMSFGAAAADPFAENVRPTEALKPGQEQRSFHLPPGFEMQLVAAESDILKPMNLAFDAQGRLWVTVTREYPFPVPPGKPSRDQIKILSDFDEAGRARKVTTFAEGLDIPIGIYPFQNTNGNWKCVAWSIPNIWLFEDTDGDGKADKQEKLYGPFGWERDTHGMNSSFTRGFDGWLYATHGYNNNTDVRGADGHEVKMNSGNTYRIRLDGSRIEQNTWGQVNPFGLCFDALGNLYSADCHSEPVYQLLRGGYYPSFGKPDDGLGFAPSMIFHGHGSTAISGIVYYEDDLWPEEYRNNIFTGNVMTSRVNRDAVTFTGSTPLANERPDFVVTDDPWFRPVNLQLGPDGALYIADFYNRIIGHYEVPLTHPGRDRTSGRIWRIVYKGADDKAKLRPLALPDNLDGLIAELASPNLTRRMLAMNTISDRFSKSAVTKLEAALSGAANEFQLVHILWLLHRLDAIKPAELDAAHTSRDVLPGVHAQRIAADTIYRDSLPGLPLDTDRIATAHMIAIQGLSDGDPLVQRCAAEAVGKLNVITGDNVRALLGLLARVPREDTHLLYTVRKALRDQLRDNGIFDRVTKATLSEQDERAIADVAVAVPSPEAGEFLLRHVQKYSEKKETLANYLRHAARYAPENEMDSLATFTRKKFADDPDFQLALFKSVQQGTEQRGATLTGGVRDWGAELAQRLLESADVNSPEWSNTPVQGMANTTDPWFVQERVSADGDKSSWFLCSLPPGGESFTGVLRSKPFTIPARLNFFLAGHDGYPDKPALKKNVVRLRTAASDQVLAETFPPRNDTAQPVTWDLSAFAGRQGYLEVTDADNGNAYAWLAIGRFDPPLVVVPKVSPNTIGQRLQAAAELVRALSLAIFRPQLARALVNPATDIGACGAVAETLVALHPDEILAALAPMAGDPAVSMGLRRQIAQAIARSKGPEGEAILNEAFRTLTRRLQVKLAAALASSPGGGEQLLKLVADGRAPAALLLERAVKDKLLASKPANVNERLAQLTKNVAAPSNEIQKLMDGRRAGFDLAKASAARGEKVFTLNCRPCHQIDGAGNVVGPQLDGVGGRGLERLIEDVLDPNRNVDPAFHTTIVSLKDGDVESGLFRREEGEAIVLANGAGKEISIPKRDIVDRHASTTSLMPENFGEIISPQDFNDLMAFLLAHGPKPGSK
ncbi:MAG TPA: PVC-type heme-binding CxxCH protein [Candidatus Angelobacter sp.]|nr:PVC-type heme-binding CxxCH protein [Candidatus Angelobacter sp.]